MKGRRKKVLLIEPNYANKYPPIALMKLATYYRNRQWDVRFFKGDLRELVIERVADKCVADFQQTDASVDWFLVREHIMDYIRTRRREAAERIGIERSAQEVVLTGKLAVWKDYYHKGEWRRHPEYDRVGVTTLFTFYWDITVETINFAKLLVKHKKDLMVGGVLASLQPEALYKATGIRPHVGVLDQPGVLDAGDTQIIDCLPLDYSILDETDYRYPMRDAYYGYMTRGCIRHCPFCAVPTLEPAYTPFLPIKARVEATRARYGDQRDLLLMDNNVLASERFADIIADIRAAGFAAGATCMPPDELAVALRGLKDGVNDRAYTRKCQRLLAELYQKLRPRHAEDAYVVYKTMKLHHVFAPATTRRESLIAACEELMPLWQKHRHPVPRRRTVDFNQGVDARLFTEEKARLLATIALRPLRIAFDDLHTRPAYERAIRMSAAAGLRDFSNYLLYNFRDEPVDLYRRLRINVELCEELDVSIYSFPMKYHPIRPEAGWTEDFSHNRDYIGPHWCRKHIRAVQAILNSTKGKVGRGRSFFLEAFGHDEAEYMELLDMPEAFILYRFFFKWLDEQGAQGVAHWRACRAECLARADDDETRRVRNIIARNTFSDKEIAELQTDEARRLMTFYTDYRKDIITPGTRLYTLKAEYDRHPTIALKRKKHHE